MTFFHGETCNGQIWHLQMNCFATSELIIHLNSWKLTSKICPNNYQSCRFWVWGILRR